MWQLSLSWKCNKHQHSQQSSFIQSKRRYVSNDATFTLLLILLYAMSLISIACSESSDSNQISRPSSAPDFGSAQTRTSTKPTFNPTSRHPSRIGQPTEHQKYFKSYNEPLQGVNAESRRLNGNDDHIIDLESNLRDDHQPAASVNTNNDNYESSKRTTNVDLTTEKAKSDDGTMGEQGEKLLLQALMRGYDSDVRPVRNASHPILIQVGITLTQIFDMDEKNQVLTTNVWLDQPTHAFYCNKLKYLTFPILMKEFEWNDELLRWDPADFGGLQAIRLPCRKICADDYERGYMPSRAMVSNGGNVFWPPPTKFRSTCAVDVTYFPFDDQVCTLKLGSWAYAGDQVDITNRSSDVDLSNYVQNGEWELLEARLQRNVVFYSCCPEPFPSVTVTLVIRRKTLYYIYNVVLPCMMLSILTLLVFCLPPDSGEKVALGITVLLAFSVFMLAIAEKMPETSTSIPLIGIYLTAVMAITSISVIVTVVVLNLHYLGPRVQPIPSWLRSFLPKDDIDFLREKSLLLPHVARTGVNRRTQQVYLISQHRPNQHGPMSYSTSVPPAPTLNVNNNNSTTPSNMTMTSPGQGSYDEVQHNQTVPMSNHHKHTGPVRVRRHVSPQEFGPPIDEEEEVGMRGSDAMDESSTDSLDDNENGVPNTPDRTEAAKVRETRSLIYPVQRHRHSSNSPPHHQVRLAHAIHHRSKVLSHLSPHRRVHRLANANTGFVKQNTNANSTKMSSPAPALPATSSAASMSKIQEELLKSIQHLLMKQEDLEFQNLLVAEWRLVAQVIDRILFWIFFVITIASSGVFLLILPLYKRSWNGPS